MASRRLVYQQGNHICTLYGSLNEQLKTAAEYIKAGLGRGERCMYIYDEHTLGQLLAALQKAGIDVTSEVARGALLLDTKRDAHLKGGHFAADRMISLLHQAVKDALDAGFAGLCAGGDMSWVMDQTPGTEELAEYESRVNDFYANNRALGLCQYNRKTLLHEFLDHGIATHRVIGIEGPVVLENPFYEEPEQAIGRNASTEAGVRGKMATILAQAGRGKRAARSER